jgi:SHS2 domain-containing protein
MIRCCESMSYSFRFLEDVALGDIAFEVKGDAVEELFRGATEALLETLANPGTVASSWTRPITKTDEDVANLLFEWLSEIVYWKDAAGVVFHEAPLTLTRVKGKWTLQVRLVGAPVDRLSQELHNDVKGVTKHLYELRHQDEKWQTRVVLDV